MRGHQLILLQIPAAPSHHAGIKPAMAPVAGFYFLARAKPTKKTPGQETGANQGTDEFLVSREGEAGAIYSIQGTTLLRALVPLF